MGLFWKPTPFNVTRLLNANAPASDCDAREIIEQWRAAHCEGRALEPYDLVLTLPAPHCVLLASRFWRSYGFPVPMTNRQRSRTGLFLVKPLWAELFFSAPA